MSSPGIKHHASKTPPYADVYTGTLEDLVSAGLIKREQLPGKPGLPKTRVSYLPDGSRARNGGRTNYWIEGYKVVRKAGQTKFAVEITLDTIALEQRCSRRCRENIKRYEHSDQGREDKRRCDDEKATKEQAIADSSKRMIDGLRAELALSDEQLAAKERNKLRALIACHEMDLHSSMTTLQSLARLKAPAVRQAHLTLAWSASK